MNLTLVALFLTCTTIRACDAMRYLTSVTDMAWVQLPEWSDSVRIISSIWFEINFTDWQEGLTVSSNL